MVGFCFFELLKGGIGNGFVNFGDWNIGMVIICFGLMFVMCIIVSWRRFVLLDRVIKGYDYMVVN